MRTLSFFAIALCLCATSATAAGRRRAVTLPPPGGPCQVRGLPNFFYSTDGGTTWSRNAETPTRSFGVADIAILDADPEALVVVAGDVVYDSLDAGCTWTARHAITEEIHHSIHLVPAPGNRAFIWTEEFVLRYDSSQVIPLVIPERIGGLGVDPGNRDHVRILGVAAGTSWESFDGGGSWKAVGGAAGGAINGAAFDPSDFRHILAGVQTRGIRISRDGGKSWSDGAAVSGGLCSVRFVPGRPDIVWVGGGTQGAAPTVRRSTDSGAHLEAIAKVPTAPNGVCLHVLPNPHNPNEATVPFGDFFKFDAVTKSVTPWNCCGGRMTWIAWSPRDHARVYVSAPLK